MRIIGHSTHVKTMLSLIPHTEFEILGIGGA
jgi:hypothetical protein